MSELRPLEPLSVTGEVLEQLPRGAFLTVKWRNRVNVMTIGWGTVGIVWSRPILVVPVRKTRYTFGLIEHAPAFTVTFPIDGQYKTQLGICGTESGRNVDKISKCGFTTRPGEQVDTPVLDIPGIHFECRTVLRGPIDPGQMHPDIASCYAQEDYHTFYYGEIVRAVRQV